MHADTIDDCPPSPNRCTTPTDDKWMGKGRNERRRKKKKKREKKVLRFLMVVEQGKARTKRKPDIDTTRSALA